MTEENHFLKYFFDQDIYVIHDGTDTTPVKTEETATEDEVKEESGTLLSSLLDKSTIFMVITGSLSDKQRDLLAAILKAVNHDLDSIGLIETDHHDDLTFDFENCEKLEKVIIFDHEQKQLISFVPQTKYSIASNDQLKILLADNLDLIASDVEKKKLLWGQLQILFPKS